MTMLFWITLICGIIGLLCAFILGMIFGAWRMYKQQAKRDTQLVQDMSDLIVETEKNMSPNFYAGVMAAYDLLVKYFKMNTEG